MKHEGSELVRVIGSSRGKNNRATYETYVSAITFASDSIHLTSSHFVPDRQTMEAMFRRDLDDSDMISLVSWERRSLAEHMKEAFSRLFSYWL